MEIYQVESNEHKQHVRDLFWEYLQWGNQSVNEAFNINFDIEAMIEDDMQTLDKFLPPEGRLVLGEVDGQIGGVACMKQLNDTVCEIKRMYVRPAFRGRGLGRMLLQRLIDEARQMDYPIMRLDSARILKTAHALFRSTQLASRKSHLTREAKFLQNSNNTGFLWSFVCNKVATPGR